MKQKISNQRLSEMTRDQLFGFSHEEVAEIAAELLHLREGRKLLGTVVFEQPHCRVVLREDHLCSERRDGEDALGVARWRRARLDGEETEILRDALLAVLGKKS